MKRRDFIKNLSILALLNKFDVTPVESLKEDYIIKESSPMSSPTGILFYYDAIYNNEGGKIQFKEMLKKTF